MNIFLSTTCVTLIGAGSLYMVTTQDYQLANPLLLWSFSYFSLDFMMLLFKRLNPPQGLTSLEMIEYKKNHHSTFFLHHSIGIISILLHYYLGAYQKYLVGY